MRVAAGKVAARGTHIGHEEGVADEHRVADAIGHVGGGVAGDMHGAGGEGADVECFAVGKQVAELGAVELELRLEVEDLLEHALHGADAFADGDGSAQLPLQVGRGGKVVGVGVGFQQPLGAQAVLAHIGDDAVGALSGGAARFGIVVQHRIDDGTGAAGGGFVHDVGNGGGDRVEKGLDLWRHGGRLGRRTAGSMEQYIFFNNIV